MVKVLAFSFVLRYYSSICYLLLILGSHTVHGGREGVLSVSVPFYDWSAEQRQLFKITEVVL